MKSQKILKDEVYKKTKEGLTSFLKNEEVIVDTVEKTTVVVRTGGNTHRIAKRCFYNCHPNDFMIIAADGASSMGNFENRDGYLAWRRRLKHKKIQTIKGYPTFDLIKKYLRDINKNGYEDFRVWST